jgi:predicted nucleotidyltransferase
MAISEAQLKTWSNQGATTSSANTYNSIKTCIEVINWNDDVSYEIYLQGSYKNTTNIYGDSDVDVVVEFTSIFYSNKYDLPADQLKEYNEYHSDGKYTLESFQESVVKGLQKYYGEEYVKVGNKSIKVLANSGRLDCDVICCAEYREYKSFSKTKTTDFAKGIVFWTNTTNQKVVNFPKIHYENGVAKNQTSNSNYKPSVRIIKNMKSKLIDSNKISKTTAPSYFIECLMYNVPNGCFSHVDNQSIILATLKTFHSYSDSDIENLYCQNGQRKLVGTSDQQWNLADCKEFIRHLILLWNEG